MPSIYVHNIFIGRAKSTGLPPIAEASDSIFEGFGILYKHCKDEHLPGKHSTIRFGTLSEYRRNENIAVRDKDEGMFRITLNFPNRTRVRRSSLREATFDTSPLFAGVHQSNLRVRAFDGYLTTGTVYSTDDVQIESQTEDSIVMSGLINIYAEGTDAYVLCFSQNHELGKVIKDDSYNSRWNVRQGRVMEFAGRAARLIREKLLSDKRYISHRTIGPLRSSVLAQPPKNSYMVANVSAEIWQVLYREKEMIVRADFTDDIISDIHECINRSAFIKPLEFEHEREIRIIFRPCVIDSRDGTRYLLPNYLEPMLISFAPFLDLVETGFEVDFAVRRAATL